MILAACLGGTKAYVDHRLRTELDNSIKSIADKVTIEYVEVSTSLLGSVVISDLHLTVPDYTPVHIDTVTLYKAYQFYNPNALPEHISLALQDVHIPISDTAPPVPILLSAFGYAPYYLSPKELRGLGYTHVNANIYIEAKLREEGVFLSGTVNAHAWGEIMVSIDLDNVPASLRAAASRIQLAALTFSYTNKGLVNRIFTLLAQRHKISLDNFKQALFTKLKSDIHQTRISLDASVLASVQQFIQTPNKLTIHLQPSPPILMNALFQTSPKRLGLKITTLD
ncbi:MAG TPA: hypothetical protein ENG03_01975 [Thioploca sp.]|nr:MAG: hypothetical protein DRR19_13850 [Gammaproteobacteria bacterium]HDN25868.1 hypothetical protein [Thioploca sp.]